MDPNETLRMMLDNLAAASVSDITDTARTNYNRHAAEHARDLASWLERGGFAPQVEAVGPISDTSWKVGR